MKNEYPILSLCEHLEVSSSGYHDWHKWLLCPWPRAAENQTLAYEINQIHAQSRQTYGSPRVVEELRKKGRRHGRNRVARLMKEKGLCGRQKGRHRVQTTDSNHDEPIAPNRLAEASKATAPNQLWVADITYIETKEGWLYLAAILDLCSRKIVGCAMSERIDTSLVLKALAMALLHRTPPANLLFHSDRGVQYASGNYRQALSQAGFVASMSRRGNCYDNATMEIPSAPASARALLRMLSDKMKAGVFNAGNPDTLLCYEEAIVAMGMTPISGGGKWRQLGEAGMDAQNEWARDNRLPAVTGLIAKKVNGRAKVPGDGYSTSNNRSHGDKTWWLSQVDSAINFGWEL